MFNYQELVELDIVKLVFGGQALAFKDGETFFVWNGLPGEKVTARILHRRKKIYEAVAEKIITPSPERQNFEEDHYLSCSPWQIMSPALELMSKKEIALEVLKKFAGLTPKDLAIVNDENYDHYRGKMEFSFTTEKNQASLAFFGRQSHELIPFDSCVLASPSITTASQALVAWLNTRHYPAQKIKSLMLRSNLAGEVLAGLFVVDSTCSLKIEAVVKPPLIGLELYYSDPRSPASVPTKLLARQGSEILIEKINGREFEYGLFSFFQINPLLFQLTLADIAAQIDEADDLLDFYGGVGVIGLSLASQVKTVTIIEAEKSAVALAQKNIALNKLKNVTVLAEPAERALSLITGESTVIFDPPRAGLSPAIIDKLIAARPPKIIYLSCNLATQARDLKLLSDFYEPTFSRLYNFFPRTPHFESLMVLARR